MTRHVSTLDLHRLRYGELPTAHEADVRTHLDGCDVCAERHRVQLAEREAFALRPVPPALGALDTPAPSWRRWIPAFGLVAAAAVALFAVAPQLAPTEPVPTERPKGDLADLEVWVGTPDGPRPLRPNEALRAGDRVQILFDAHGADEVWLAGRDGSGLIEVYGRITPEDVQGLQPAPFALTLDDTPGVQEFGVFVPDQRVDAEDVKMWMAGDVHPPGRWSVLGVPKE